MSRCFPFPPPGYDKKITAGETDPLLKEKYKEKKQKKDKDKEKTSRDRSKDKHKERKEKHKDRKDKEKDDAKSKPLEEKKAEVLLETGHREKLVTNFVTNNSNGESKSVQDLARRIRYEEEATGSQSAQKITNQKVNSSFSPVQETNHRGNDNPVGRVSFGADHKRAEAMGKPMKNRDRTRDAESPEKNRRRESATKSDKRRDKEGVKENKANGEEKETESIIKTHHHEKAKLTEGSKLEERGKDYLDIRNGRPPPDISNLIGIRKDLETSGILYVLSNHENGTTPSKLQRHSASVQNGRTLAVYRTPASEVQGRTCKPEVKEVKINGFVVPGEKQKLCPPNTLAATMKMKVKEYGEASAKQPHPDLKYLNQIVNVPERELFMELDDDQDWLYGPLGVKLKKGRTDSLDSGESFQVWNQAFRIESADVSALPYVVPF